MCKYFAQKSANDITLNFFAFKLDFFPKKLLQIFGKNRGSQPVKNQEPQILTVLRQRATYSHGQTNHIDQQHSHIPFLGQIYNKCHIQQSNSY